MNHNSNPLLGGNCPAQDSKTNHCCKILADIVLYCNISQET